MISFNYELDFRLSNEAEISEWICAVILSEEFKEGDINFIFCDDEYLLKLNVEFLKHNALTDIISFESSVGKELHGDIFVSVQRVKENAKDFGVAFNDELKRVLVHGVLHFCGYKDKTDDDAKEMRGKENHYLSRLKHKS